MFRNRAAVCVSDGIKPEWVHPVCEHGMPIEQTCWVFSIRWLYAHGMAGAAPMIIPCPLVPSWTCWYN